MSFTFDSIQTNSDDSINHIELLNAEIQLNKTKHKVLLNYKAAEYKGKKYLVCRAKKRIGTDQLFVIDDDMLEKVKYVNWHETNTYITHTLQSKCIYMHNYVMNKLTFDGKGQATTVDHINRIGTDNRRENLRLVTQSKQNMNQKKKKRIVELPAECGFTADDMPTGINYHKPKDKFGEFFELDIKGLPEDQVPNGRFRRYTTKSKSVSLQCKLEEAKKYLRELAEKFPEIVEFRDKENEYNEKAIELIKSYNDIIRLSNYPDCEKYVVPIPERHELPNAALNEAEQQVLANTTIEVKGKKHAVNKLPDDCGVTKNMIPKYCYYNPASDTRSDSFAIERHPGLLVQGKNSWRTTGSSKLTTKQKFDLLLEKLNELNL